MNYNISQHFCALILWNRQNSAHLAPRRMSCKYLPCLEFLLYDTRTGNCHPDSPRFPPAFMATRIRPLFGRPLNTHPHHNPLHSGRVVGFILLYLRATQLKISKQCQFSAIKKNEKTNFRRRKNAELVRSHKNPIFNNSIQI